MMTTPILLMVFSAVLFMVATYWTILSYRRHRTNLLISEELQRIIDNTSATIDESKKIISKERERAAERVKYPPATPDNIMDSPELMATIITVLVHKIGGEVRLGMQDFMLPDEQGVSVYVDTETEEILLSTDHELAIDPALLSFSNPDDNTYH